MLSIIMIGSQLYQSMDLFTFESLLEMLFLLRFFTLLFSAYMLYMSIVGKKLV